MDYNVYSKLRSRVNKKVKQDKIHHFKNLFANVSDSSTFWSTFNRMTKPGRSTIPPLTDPNGIVVDNSEALSELFATQFQDAFNVASSPSWIGDCDDHVSPDHYCTEFDVRTYINMLSLRKPVGVDGIDTHFLKFGVDIIAPSLAALINKCVTRCEIPNECKHAIVAPVFVITAKCRKNNYVL